MLPSLRPSHSSQHTCLGSSEASQVLGPQRLATRCPPQTSASMPWHPKTPPKTTCKTWSAPWKRATAAAPNRSSLGSRDWVSRMQMRQRPRPRPHLMNESEGRKTIHGKWNDGMKFLQFDLIHWRTHSDWCFWCWRCLLYPCFECIHERFCFMMYDRKRRGSVRLREGEVNVYNRRDARRRSLVVL